MLHSLMLSWLEPRHLASQVRFVGYRGTQTGIQAQQRCHQDVSSDCAKCCLGLLQVAATRSHAAYCLNFIGSVFCVFHQKLGGRRPQHGGFCRSRFCGLGIIGFWSQPIAMLCFFLEERSCPYTTCV